MVAPRKRIPRWHAVFLAMLPSIRRCASLAFRSYKPEAREDAIVEVIANACVAFYALVKKGKMDLAYPTVLANYGIRQFLDHRRVGNKRSIRDVLSPFCQKKKHVKVERLDRFDTEEGEWMEAIVEDRHAGPAETAAARLDLRDWFNSMPSRRRRIAQALAVGERTTDVAKRFKLSPGRISQMRDEFHKNWQQFNGEAA